MKTKILKYPKSGLRVEFRLDENSVKDSYMEVSSESGIFGLRFGARSYPFGYLMAAVKQGHEDEPELFASTLYQLGSLLYTDEEFARDVVKALSASFERRQEQAAENAGLVRDADLAADADFMKDLVNYLKDESDI